MSKIETLNADEVAEFLHHHPQFFEAYPELITTMVVPHPHEGEVIHLTQHQMLTLRSKNDRLKTTLGKLISYAKENDQLSDKLHQLILKLIAAQTQEAVFTLIARSLPSIFQISHLALRFWSPYTLNSSSIKLPLTVESYFSQHQTAHCSSTIPQEMRQWFDENDLILQSFVVIPLGYTKPFGALVLGSIDPHRFNLEDDTMYLERLRTLLTEAILAKH